MNKLQQPKVTAREEKMENGGDQRRNLNPSNGEGEEQLNKEEQKPKVVVIMGPTGSGKSKLAIDLASHFPVEIINADSMQVYKGLDVLSNKVPLQEQKGLSPFSLCVCILVCKFCFFCYLGLRYVIYRSSASSSGNCKSQRRVYC